MRFFIFMLLIPNICFAINNCEHPDARNKYICVIAGGSANTDIAMNDGHARSLALKTARLLAYEKLAEKIKGVLIGSKANLSQQSLEEAEIKTIVSAKLRNINIEKETLKYLRDGSPWAEVTVSVPNFGGYEQEEVVNYENGTSEKNKEKKLKGRGVVLDLRGKRYSPNLKVRIVAQNGRMIYSGQSASNISYQKSISNALELSQIGHEAKIIRTLGVNSAGEIEVSNEDALYLLHHNFEKESLNNGRLSIILD